MKNEVTKTVNTELAVFNDDDFSNVGPEQNLGRNDILIPKLLTMQGQSPQVLEGVASFGEIVDSLNWQKHAAAAIGKKEALTLEILPFFWKKYWIIKRLVGEKFDFNAMEEITPETENLNPYDLWVGDDGATYKRVYLHLFYVLLDGHDLPFTIGFRGASKKAGDALATRMFIQNKMRNVAENWKKSPMASWMVLTPKRETKNDNTYIVLETAYGKDATLPEASKALKWYKDISNGISDVQVDHSDIINESEGTSTIGVDPKDAKF